MDEKTKKKEGGFKESDLEANQLKDFRFVKERINRLQISRQNHYGHDLDRIWSDADKDYIPHRLKAKGKKVTSVDEDKGWRSSSVNLGSPDWQSDVSQANPFVKTQVALSILVDQNPGAVFTPVAKKYTATTEIVKQLYQRSWEYAKSKNQLKLFVFNLAKYGWACARTYPLRITRKVKVLEEYNQDDPEKSVYKEKEVVEYNDIMRENLDPRNTWIDDMAKPGSNRTLNDWCYRKVYDIEAFREEFGKYSRAEFVTAGGNTQETLSAEKGGSKNSQKDSKTLVEVWFYENLAKDLFMVIAGDVPVIIEPLPVADDKGLKRLTLWQTIWNLRHAESPYGIGIYEAIRFDQSILDRIRNMTIDQLTLSIYKMFLFQGTQALSETGDIKITPGVGKQVLDPKNVNWLEVPGPGQDAYMGIEMFRKDIDEASGVTDPLLGNVTGKTAFEIAQAKESALKRMKNPLDNILEALNEEAYTTLALIQLLYSIPETYEITDERLINDYLKEIGGDQELFERGAPTTSEDGTETPGVFKAKVFPEFPLNLDKDEKGNLIETNETKFFRTKPSALSWRGMIQIKPQSLLSASKQVDRALELEMYNMLIPLLQGISQEYAMKQQMGQQPVLDDLTNGKVAKSIIKLYDKDPRDILPDSWLQTPQPQAVTSPMNSLFVSTNGQAPQADKLVSSTQAPMNPQSVAGKVSAEVTAPFRV